MAIRIYPASPLDSTGAHWLAHVALKQERMSSSLPPKRPIRQSDTGSIARWSSASSRRPNVADTKAQQDSAHGDTSHPDGTPTYRSTDFPPPSASATGGNGSQPDGKFLPWLTWSFSLLLPVALVLALGTLVWHSTRGADALELTVVGGPDGIAIPGATVTIGSEEFTTPESGTVKLTLPETEQVLRIEAPGYHAVEGRISLESSRAQQVTLRPNVLTGVLTDQATGAGLPNVSVVALDINGNQVSTAVSGADGTYRLENLPESGSIQIDAGSYGSHSASLGEDLTLDLALSVQTASGVVLNADGAPIQGAVIQSGDVTAVSTGDGTYLLDGVNEGDEIIVRASGFESQTATISAGGTVAEVRLPHQMVKAVYANYNLLTTEGGIESLIEIANTTEINAIVIDVKEGVIFYDSEVPFFNEVGTVRPVYDLDAILAKLKDNGIYAIARMVVFQDPLVAEARPDLAVHDVNGGLWVNVQGVGWVSAFHEELWQANIDLAVELVERGFDEVQYDYVRFPSDGDLSTADFGQEYTAATRESAITEFMRRSHEAVNTAGGYLAADLFGFVTIMDDEQYIGQRFSALAPYLDFVCMMIYPSHFEEGNIASAPGHPNDYPYETIYESLERADMIVPDSRLKFRPWLQDFSYGYKGLRDYTPEDVRAQIDAAEDFGASGWMLWGDPMNVTVEALAPEPVTQSEILGLAVVGRRSVAS